MPEHDALVRHQVVNTADVLERVFSVQNTFLSLPSYLAPQYDPTCYLWPLSGSSVLETIMESCAAKIRTISSTTKLLQLCKSVNPPLLWNVSDLDSQLQET